MKSLNSAIVVLGLVMGASVLVASDASAVTKFRSLSANAASYCQTSLPTFDGQVRKRPLAVQNEGNSSAFITCAFTRQGTNSGTSATAINIYALNSSTSDKHITCTLVTGFATGSNQFVPKTVTLPAGGTTQKFMEWLPADFTGGIFPDSQYSMTCNVLPGVGLNDSYLTFDEDVGD